MKRCPSCNTQYTDDTLKFCLQDGTPLVSGSESETPTVVLGETETVAARVAAGQQSQVTQIAAAMPPAKRSKTSVFVIAAGVLVFAVMSVGAIVATLLRNFPGPAAATNINISTPTPDPRFKNLPSTMPTPGTSPAGSPTANDNVFTQPPADKQQVEHEIEQTVNTWKSQLEAHDINAYMSHYAYMVEYYGAGTVSALRIRTDKERAMSLYSSIRVTVSNMSYTVNPVGDAATAVFDKEWVFAGNSRNEGKTRAQLDFKRAGGKWLITTEKDQKVYYTR